MKSMKIVIPIAILVAIVSIVLIVINVTKKDELYGLWDIDGTTKYEFNGYGKGTLIVPLDEYEFIYTIQKDKLFIDFINPESADTTYTFSVSENVLEITNVVDEDLSFKLTRINK